MAVSVTKKEKTPKPSNSSSASRYVEAVGRRKTSVARVRLVPAAKTTFSINDEALDKYFATPDLKKTATAALEEVSEKFTITAKIKGGGIVSQSEALRHGLGRALVSLYPDMRVKLKSKGFLKRDPRAKERRKFGLKKARKAPQWSKR